MEKIERLERVLMYQGTILKIYKDVVKLPNGETADWDYIHHNGATAVVPVMPDGRILMVCQSESSKSVSAYPISAPVLPGSALMSGFLAYIALLAAPGPISQMLLVQWLRRIILASMAVSGQLARAS